MKNNTAYTIFDVVEIDGCPEYQLQVYALIADKKSPIIHLVACRFDCDTTTRIETLMLHIFANDYSRNSTIYFIKSIVGLQYIRINKKAIEMETCDIVNTTKKIGFNDASKGCLFELADNKSKARKWI